MDKYEYQLKLDQINKLIERNDYGTALKVANGIDWHRVRSVTTLCKIADVYERNRKYEESRELLSMAYERAPVGRMIAYRLSDISIKLHDYDQAIEYYKEFVHSAPKDPGRLILKYKIFRGKGAALKDQIAILEEYRAQEYEEEWALELAYRYEEAGDIEKCVNECDELILWFNDGKYVLEAMELKMKYQELTPAQQEKYEIRARKMKLVDTEDPKETQEREARRKRQRDLEVAEAGYPAGDYPEGTDGEGYAAGYYQEGAYEEGYAGYYQEGAYQDGAYPEAYAPEGAEYAGQEAYAGDGYQGEIPEAAEEPLPEIAVPEEMFQEAAAEREALSLEDDGQLRMDIPEYKPLEKQITGQMTIQEILTEWEKTRGGEEKAPEEAEEESAAEEMSQEAPEAEETEPAAEEASQEAPEAAETETAAEEMSQEAPEAEETEPAAEKASQVAPEAAETEYAAEEMSQEAPEAAESESAAEEMSQEAPEAAETEPAAEKARQEVPEAEETETAETEAAAREAGQEVSEGAEEESVAREAGQGAPEGAEAAEEVSGTEEMPLPEIAMPEELFAEEVPSQAQNAAEVEAEAEPALQQPEEPEREAARQEAAAEENRTAAQEGLPAQETDTAQEEVPVREETQSQPPAQERPRKKRPSAGGKGRRSRPRQAEDDDAADGLEDKITASLSRDSLVLADAGDGRLDGRIDGEKIHRTGREKSRSRQGRPSEGLTEEQKELFTYFAPVHGMSDQLWTALENEKACIRGGTSNVGNIMITGEHGTGKTKLAVNLVKAIQKGRKEKGGKLAKVSADTLNDKGARAVLSKLKGGALILEQASSLDNETAQELEAAMRGQTGGLLVIFEDEKQPLRRFMKLHPGLARMVTSRIDLPVFTNDELVEFGRCYAKELDYSIDEMAVLALYNRIGNMQRDDYDVSVTDVKKIIDEAIEKNEKRGIGKLFQSLAKKRYDDDNCIILREKDFE